MSSESAAKTLLAKAGVTINGKNPWDIQVHNSQLYDRVLSGGSIAFGEAYMDGWWDAENLEGLIYRIHMADLKEEVGINLETLMLVAGASIGNLQNKMRARDVIDVHYDIGNDLYMSFLDPYNQYTCGYFKDTDDLNTAQEQKLDLICRKLKLKKGDTVLDIGCGWGGFAKFAAERYGAIVTGISISEEQITYAREYCKGLSVTIENVDYRDVQGSFDKVVSVGMLEHVGYRNYRTYMETVSRVLKDDGLFLLHSIGENVSTKHTDPWIDKYIFRNGMTASIAQLGKAFEGLFVMEDWHNFGPYYEPTLLAWMKNFDRAWPSLKEKYGGERFYRMWKYYLLISAAAFRARKIQLWQIVLSKPGMQSSYESER